ncbi:hypothetical protein MAUB1S_00003 [Mycolicibacterium aubagnense]
MDADANGSSSKVAKRSAGSPPSSSRSSLWTSSLSAGGTRSNRLRNSRLKGSPKAPGLDAMIWPSLTYVGPRSEKVFGTCLSTFCCRLPLEKALPATRMPVRASCQPVAPMRAASTGQRHRPAWHLRGAVSSAENSLRKCLKTASTAKKVCPASPRGGGASTKTLSMSARLRTGSLPGTYVGTVCGASSGSRPPLTRAFACRNSGNGPAAVCRPLMIDHTTARRAVRSIGLGSVCPSSCLAHFGMVSRTAQSMALCGIGRFGPVAMAAPWVRASLGR